jgi:cytochrome P450
MLGNEDGTMNARSVGCPVHVDLEFYQRHYDYMDPREAQMHEAAVEFLPSQCPVVRSDAWGGFWVVNDYALARSVCSDWETYSSVPERQFTRIPGKLARSPVDTDPPVQREYRHLLNPYLTPARVAQFEPDVRDLCGELIDTFVEDGRCDLVPQFSRLFPGRMLYRSLFGIDDGDVAMVREWMMLTVLEPKHPDAPAALANWYAWIFDLIERRRAEERRDDILDALLYATIDGQPIGKDALAGAILALIEGGFSTTTDSISSAMLRLAQDQDLQTRLREDPSLIPSALDEFLRFDPPVAGAARLCTRDTVLGGVEIKRGDRVYIHIRATHRDAKEFDDPNVLDITRERNRHLAFGVGTHRCIGSNVARQNLRVALEELLARLGAFRIPDGASEARDHGPTWGPVSLPLQFAPGRRRSHRPSPVN